MARPLRIEYPNAIYHVMARGNGKQAIFHIEDDYRRMVDGLSKTVGRTGWEVFAYVWMPNHIHLFLRTPKPNLSKGMQYLLSGYANWYAKRHERTGHLFQGRFRAELVEDESYFWTLSRYLHLNPVRGKRPLVAHPRDWPWSSYPGFCSKAKQVDWIEYDGVLNAWQAEMGGSNSERAYRKFVESGIEQPPENPLKAALEGWLLGSEEFLKRMKKLLSKPKQMDQVPKARKLSSLNASDVISIVAEYFGTTAESFQTRRTASVERDIAAWMAHRRTTSTLRELSGVFGLRHPDSVSNLIRRAEAAINQSANIANQIKHLDKLLSKTENRV